MNENAALGAIKRRWWVVVLFVIVGAVAGALPQPETVEEQEEVVRTFTATHTMLTNDTPDAAVATAVSPNQVTLFATTGEVPKRAASTLEFDGNPAALASRVQAFFDFSTGALTITVTGEDPADAVLIADTFAEELTSYLAERQDITYQERLAAAIERLATLEQQLNDITRDLARDPEDPVVSAQQGAISRQYSVAFEQSEALSASPPVLGFTTLERAQAVEITDASRGISAPTSRTSRAVLGAVVGGALGLAVALILGRLDRKLRTREQAEAVADLRARVMIPKVRDRDRDELVVRVGRHDPLTDAYRTVRNVVTFVQQDHGESSVAPITLVVSPTPGDGKTSLAVNVAAAMAEAGQRTIVINADFRRPRLAKAVGAAAEASLPFMLEDISVLGARTLLTATGVKNLRMMDLSGVDGSAGELVRSTIDKIPEICTLADAVVIDTSPVGATAEVLELVPYASTIVVVARLGNTTRTAMSRALAILRDLATAPILLVLGGAKSEATNYYEYTTRADKGETGSWWRRRHRDEGNAADEPELETVE